MMKPPDASFCEWGDKVNRVSIDSGIFRVHGCIGHYCVQ